MEVSGVSEQNRTAHKGRPKIKVSVNVKKICTGGLEEMSPLGLGLGTGWHVYNVIMLCASTRSSVYSTKHYMHIGGHIFILLNLVFPKTTDLLYIQIHCAFI